MWEVEIFEINFGNRQIELLENFTWNNMFRFGLYVFLRKIFLEFWEFYKGVKIVLENEIFWEN